jgi:hypothetical protein
MAAARSCADRVQGAGRLLVHGAGREARPVGVAGLGSCSVGSRGVPASGEAGAGHARLGCADRESRGEKREGGGRERLGGGGLLSVREKIGWERREVRWGPHGSEI